MSTQQGHGQQQAPARDNSSRALITEMMQGFVMSFYPPLQLLVNLISSLSLNRAFLVSIDSSALAIASFISSAPPETRIPAAALSTAISLLASLSSPLSIERRIWAFSLTFPPFISSGFLLVNPK